MCWGYVRNVLGPIVPWCSVFGNPSPSILCCSQRLLPPPSSPTHMHGHTRTHKPTGTNTPPGQCVPWSLTLNRPPRLNTTDRQASGHQVHQVKHGDWASKTQPVIFTCLLREKENKTKASVSLTQFCPGSTTWPSLNVCTLISAIWDLPRQILRSFFNCPFPLWMFLKNQLDPLKHFAS